MPSRSRVDGIGSPFVPDVLEPTRAAILFLQEVRSVEEFTSRALLALRRVGAVEEGDMAVSDIFEPVDFARVFEETDSDGVNGSVAPALVEETSGAVEVLEVGFVDG